MLANSTFCKSTGEEEIFRERRVQFANLKTTIMVVSAYFVPKTTSFLREEQSIRKLEKGY